MTAHAELRAMLEALPGLSVTEASVAEVVKWLIHAPAMVRALLDERDKLAQVADNTVDKPAEPITDELRLRCELAATVLSGMLARMEVGSVEQEAGLAHQYADALLAEGRRRMAAEREAKP